MSLNRRQFLILAGTAGGAGLAFLAHQALTAGSRSPSPVVATSPESPSLAETTQVVKTAIAPKGLFAPVRGDVRIVVISDLNSAYGSTDYEAEVHQAIAMIPDWQPDIVLAGGDMVAGQSPSLSTAEIQAMWAGFDRYIAAPLRQAKLPFGFTIGNHDASGAVGLQGGFLFANERDLAAAYWNDPRHDPRLPFVDRAKFPFYYTFQQQDIFYLVWDASTSQIPPDQLAWAERALASATAQGAKMRIAIGHLPLYAVAVGRDSAGEVLANAEQLGAMLEKYKVHTYISGHHHAYFPGHRGKLELLHTSALGSGPRPLLNSSLPPYKTLTVIDVDLGSELTLYTTYNMQTLQVVDHKTLPRLIVGPTGRVLRLDIQESDLTAAEQTLTYTPS
ncbi:metallophosphoesterase family protein [Pantanalinema sp. GBBB05]|uniref:metallophosphoesterase family protein n=1 Tax=Pantanalinema sp. GBBB05 TaxID=2604139 RepID=UPI001DD3083D|nr:metallophosphoesterase [Pantanalinema sp. GBBB05]